MHKTIFTIDGIAPAYIGYTSGRLWNGWATPYFEKNEAFKVMVDYNKEDTDRTMWYDRETDSFRINETEYSDAEVWKGENIQTEEGTKHLYGIGAYCWVWDAVNDGDRRYLAQEIEEFIFYYDTYQYRDEYGIERKQTVETIIEQLKDLETFHKAICIMRNENLTEELRFKQLGGILKL